MGGTRWILLVVSMCNEVMISRGPSDLCTLCTVSYASCVVCGMLADASTAESALVQRMDQPYPNMFACISGCYLLFASSQSCTML